MREWVGTVDRREWVGPGLQDAFTGKEYVGAGYAKLQRPGITMTFDEGFYDNED